MKEIVINVDSCNSESIKTIQGNNNAEFYKIYLLENERRLSLVGKTVKFGYVMNGTTKGDIIEDLNISNAEQGEITFPITNKISKKDGVYTCQLAIYGADEFLEYTATFGLTVQANIFTKIAGEIADTKDLTYIESILEEAKTVSRDLKTNIPVATNLNSSLESNISNARNINTTLADTTEKSKVAATDAIEKKSQLENSITKAKEFIDGLDGSQNIPQLRLDVTELQNGLKSNQALSYEGSSISANDTLEGRTEGMKIRGRTLQNIVGEKQYHTGGQWTGEKFMVNEILDGNGYLIDFDGSLLKSGETYLVGCYLENLNDIAINSQVSFGVLDKTNNSWNTIKVINNPKNGWNILELTVNSANTIGRIRFRNSQPIPNENEKCTVTLSKFIYIKKENNDWFVQNPSYFTGIKSVGEAEDNKISILSNSENLVDTNNSELWQLNKGLWSHGNGENPNVNGGMITDYIDISYIKNVTLFLKGRTSNYFFCCYDENKKALMNLNKQYLKPSNAKFIRFFVLVNENNTPLTRFENPYLMLSYDTFKDYKPYKQDKKDILIKEPLQEGDYLYEDNGQVKIYRDVEQYTFTGDESINLLTTKDTFISFFIDLKNIDMKAPVKLICNLFGNSDRTNISNATIEGICDSSIKNRILISINKLKLTTPDVAGFRAWLKANSTTMVYQLAEPTIETVENCVDIDLDTYQEKTYFNILNSLPGTLDFKVPSNIGSLVQSNAKEINNINEFINNFILKALLEMNKDLAAIKIKNGLN